MPRRRKSRMQTESKAKTGSAIGSTTPENAVQWGEPLDNVEVSASYDTTVMDTKVSESSSEPTLSASSTILSSPIRMGSRLAAGSY